MDPVTPWTDSLEEGTYEVVMPSNVEVEGNIYNFREWEDKTTNPARIVDLISDLTIGATYELASPPPPGKGFLEVHAFYIRAAERPRRTGEEVPADGLIIETGQTFITPATLELDVGVYTVQCTYEEVTKTEIAEVFGGQTVRVDFQFEFTPMFPRLRKRLEPWFPGVYTLVDSVRKTFNRRRRLLNVR